MVAENWKDDVDPCRLPGDADPNTFQAYGELLRYCRPLYISYILHMVDDLEHYLNGVSLSADSTRFPFPYVV